jgi:biotin-dependent carboxylase-like uncharacterized protein
MSRLEVLVAGPASTVQDLGRPGFGAFGVPEGGAMDRRLVALANRRAGNPAGAAALEFVLTGPRLRWTGRRRLRCVVAGDSISEETLAPGEELAAGVLHDRAYGYVAVHGGFDVPVVMGARGTCLPGAFGGFMGRELRAGDVLPVGAAAAAVPAPPAVPAAPVVPEAPAVAPDGDVLDQPAADPHGMVTLRVLPGDRQTARARTFGALLASPWVVGDGNRVGIRLQGPALSARPLHLSQPIPPGAVQVSGAGQPIVLLRDHPTVGGYPVIAVVIAEDLDLAARLRPGSALRFVAA